MTKKKKKNKWDNIDWDEALKNPVNIPQETLIQRLKTLQRKQQGLPRWLYLKLFTALIYIMLYLSLASYFIINRVPYTGVIMPIIIGHTYLLIDYFVQIYGKTRHR